MRPLHLVALLALAVAGQASCHSTAPGTVTLVYGADQLGYLAPCGCSEHQLGGAARAAAYVEQTSQSAPTLFVEGGNLLFGTLHPSVEERDQLQAKALALARSWERAAAGATRSFRLGPYDLPLGMELAQKALSSEPLLEAGRIVESAGNKVGLLPLSFSKEPGSPGQASVLRQQWAQVVIAVV